MTGDEGGDPVDRPVPMLRDRAAALLALAHADRAFDAAVRGDPKGKVANLESALEQVLLMCEYLLHREGR